MDVEFKGINGQEASEFASQENLLLYETSARTGKNVTGVFTEVCKILMKKK